MANTSQPFDKPVGRMPVLQFLQPDELKIDPKYQRSIEGEDSQRLIRSIARSWNWGLCLPLVVSRRASDGLFVIDGQHRLEAARLRGDIPHLPCVVAEYETAASEAADFVELNQRRRPLSAIDIFKAAIAAGDKEAVAISVAIDAAGLSLAPHLTSVAWKPGMVGHIGGIRSAWKRCGEHITSTALRMLAKCYRGEVLQYAGTIWPGLVALCDRDFSSGQFEAALFDTHCERLREVGQKKLRRKIMLLAANDGTTRNEAARSAVLDVAAVPAPIAPLPSKDLASEPKARVGVPAGHLPLDSYDLRTKAKAEFCEQCEMLKRPEEVGRCTSKWCSLRDARA